MVLVNTIIAYSHIADYYYTDGIDVFRKIKKEKGALNYRVRDNGKSIKITEENCDEINKLMGRNYFFDNKKLYRKIKWQQDHDGYFFIMTNSRHHPTKISQHRLVYFYHNNIIPPENYVIDHIDRIRTNNSINNLRLVTFKINANNTDFTQKRLNHSKYVYSCFDVNTQKYICVGLANKICKYTGINVGNLNRYAKKGYTYNGQYKFFIINNLEDIHGQTSVQLA